MTTSGRSKKVKKVKKVSVYRGDVPRGETITEAPTWEELAVTVLIVAEDEAQTVMKELGPQTNFRVFADTDAIKALQRITRDRPQLVVLARAFVDTPRGAALVNTIKTDHNLGNTQIRVISRVGDYVRLVRPTQTTTASDTARFWCPVWDASKLANNTRTWGCQAPVRRPIQDPAHLSAPVLIISIRISGRIRATISANREQVFSYPEAPLRAAGATRDRTGPSSS